MKKIFNTPFETSLRILLLLSYIQSSLTKDKITAWDFIAIYGKRFGLTEHNLHGENTFLLCEYTTKRELISIAIKNLTLQGLISIDKNSNGFFYKINNTGESLAKKFNSIYAYEYKLAIEQTFEFCSKKTEQELIHHINQKINEKQR